ncbi:MAG: T9SS type A sorting domain-containing protein [Candidatus Cloacimonetes bacterium]|nr:T9SS type A sorting domain-containing protein [Candidatus Cloacimonadota bacterium]
MKRNVLFTLILISIFCVLINNGFAVQMQKTIIDKDKGYQVITIEQEVEQNPIVHSIIESRDEIQLLWQGTDEVSIAGNIYVSSTTGNTFMKWTTNNGRLSLYGDSFTPLWEENYYDKKLYMLEDGSLMASSSFFDANICEPSSSTPIWTQNFGWVSGLALSPDGSTLYVADEVGGQIHIKSIDIATHETNWDTPINCICAHFILSKSGNRILISEYDYVLVIDTEDGTLINQFPNTSQLAPAISDDGSILAFGNYTGTAYIYEYSEISQSYDLLWDFDVEGIGNPWITAVGISGNNETIGIGSYVFNPPDGKLYMFNKFSNTPIWTYGDLGDEVSDIDMSYDGSIIAMGSWGPLDNSLPDFYLFKRESNEPIFTINTPGSIEYLDLSSDGTLCTTGGKAIHSTIMGCGGTLYCMNIDVDPPAPENVVLESNENEVTISWDIPDISDFNYFNLYYSLNNNEFVWLDVVSYPTFSYNLPEPGNYQFYVTTVDNADQESEPSEIVVYEYTSMDSNNLMPMNIRLYQNYPNPFNPSTKIEFSIEQNQQNEPIKIEIYNLKGQKVKKFNIRNVKLGINEVVWNGIDENNNPVSSGIYFYKLKTGNYEHIKKMILMK